MQRFDEDEQVTWRVVRSYRTLEQAQHALHELAWARFPVRRVTIVARDVRPLDERSSRSGYGWAGLHGLALGAPIGALLGLLMALLVLAEPLAAGLTLAAWSALAGAAAGPAVSVGTEALRAPRAGRGRTVLSAGRYDVLADDQLAEQARWLLTRLGHHREGVT
jgi:hypothetical protein